MQFYFNNPTMLDEEIIYTLAPGLGIVKEQHNGWYAFEITSATLTDVGEAPGVPAGWSLGPNYPNPFNSANAGSKSVRVDAGGLPSGVYYCRLTAGSHQLVTRMLIMQ